MVTGLVSEDLHVTIPFLFFSRKALQGGLLARKGLIVGTYLRPKGLAFMVGNVFFVSSTVKAAVSPPAGRSQKVFQNQCWNVR